MTTAGPPNLLPSAYATSATAVDIPIELDALVLSFLITEYDALSFKTPQDERNHVTIHKRELGRISLVCRAWALACQPKIFEEIWLRNKEDVDTLSAFLDNPTSRIALYVRALWCNQSEVKPRSPWIHLACITLPRKFTSAPIFHMTAKTLAVKAGNPLQSLLPSHLPPSVFCLQSLSLVDIHFVRLRDILRAFAELPSLQRCACVRVTWDHSPNDLLPLPILSLSSRTSELHCMMSDCSDNSAAVCIGTMLSPTKQHRLRQRDANVLCGVGSALVKNIDLKIYPHYSVTSIRGLDALRLLATSSTTFLMPYMHITILPFGTHQEIRAIIIDFGMPWHILPLPQITPHSDWKLIDELLMSLADIKFIVLSFASKEDLEFFYESIMLEYMPKFCESSKIKYGLANEKSAARRWISCTPGTIDADIKRARWIDHYPW